MPLQIQFNKGDNYDQVKAVEVDMPKIGSEDEVLVKFLLNPVNPSDLLSIDGIYLGFQPDSFPATPGLEGIAKVIEVGKSVSSVKVGDRVIVIPGKLHGGITKKGTWTDYAVYNEDNLFTVPENVSDEAAAQAFINPATAYIMLDQIDAPKGEYIIQSAAGSVLGRILIQFAKARGVKTINLVRRKEQIEELKAIGADEVLSTEDGADIVAEIKRITNGKGAYGAVDAVGGDLGLKLCQSVRENGLILLYGVLGGLELKVDSMELMFRNVNYRGFWLIKCAVEIGKEKFHNVLKNVFELLGNGAEPFTGSRYSLNQVAEAINQSLKPGRGGKVLLVHD